MARLCYIGLWCCADDEGRFTLALRSLKKDIFGLDDITMADFVGYLKELENAKCVVFYAVGEEVFGDIPKFNIYQSINRPRKSAIPERRGSRHVTLSDVDVNAHPKELIKELIKEKEVAAVSDDWRADFIKFKGGDVCA